MARGAQDIIVRTLDSVLKEHGFSRQKKTWYLQKPEVIILVNLQKSEFSRVYYINLGVSVCALSAEASPKINKCQISHRLELLVQESERQHFVSAPNPERNNGNDTFAEQLARNPQQSIHIHTHHPKFFDTEGAHVSSIFKALDLDDESVTDSERAEAIKDAFKQHATPFFAEFDSLANIRRTLLQKGVSSGLIWASVFKLVGVPLRH